MTHILHLCMIDFTTLNCLKIQYFRLKTEHRNFGPACRCFSCLYFIKSFVNELSWGKIIWWRASNDSLECWSLPPTRIIPCRSRKGDDALNLLPAGNVPLFDKIYNFCKKWSRWTILTNLKIELRISVFRIAFQDQEDDDCFQRRGDCFLEKIYYLIQLGEVV